MLVHGSNLGSTRAHHRELVDQEGHSMSKPVYTPDQIVDLITRSGLHWAEQTVTFGFPIQDSVDAVQQEFVIEATKLWDDVTNIDLVYSGGSFGDIVFYN